MALWQERIPSVPAIMLTDPELSSFSPFKEHLQLIKNFTCQDAF
jgi:hypothetical protein